MMRKIALISLLLLASCKTEFPTETSTFNVEVQLVRPQAVPNLNIANAIVRLRSLETGKIDTAFTDSSGLAVFFDKRPGRYDIRTRLRPEEASLLRKMGSIIWSSTQTALTFQAHIGRLTKPAATPMTLTIRTCRTWCRFMSFRVLIGL